MPVDDIDSFYKKLIVLIEDKDMQKKMGSALFKTINENHAQEAVINKYTNFVSSL